ncbi:mechanosensitive ion channel [Arenibacter sp. M-2]|uniref:mechanosensitive ion channel family protein n=1 Tax=unclassified Arenibacter TaxID=2615047 RepID=UPI000D760C99|nr:MULTISPECIES: mechanosensitive ion channel domain-containing protein [unclassified Arenibacter]MDL5511622.1 mechanosensitive ion channel [Arenibacter sp. M-2]PXX24556.1 mechanosensitive ion channel-like protein [Arenibacter sp. ARW7G5Y1]|tara:strand:- start:3008 stop:3904 length:897 start_codon:yes stop_codon:yes gene_type:complete
MEELKGIIKGLEEFLSYKIWPGDKVEITTATLLTIIVTIILVTYALKLIHKLITSKLPEEDRNKFVSIFGFLRYLFYILVVLIVLHTSGVNLTVLMTASAALFVGLGFALQYLFQDIISGILIILDQSLRVGDIVEVNQKVGQVFEIRLRTTRALTRDDKVIIIPNHQFLTDSIYNYTQNHKSTRENVKVGVAYGSDVALVTKILENIASEQKGVLKNPKPFVLFEDFGDSALMFSINFFINDSYGDPKIKSAMRYIIDAKFREYNISIPFPQRDVHMFQSRPIETMQVEKKDIGNGN